MVFEGALPQGFPVASNGVSGKFPRHAFNVLPIGGALKLPRSLRVCIAVPDFLSDQEVAVVQDAVTRPCRHAL